MSQYYQNGQDPVYPAHNDQKLDYQYDAVATAEDEERLAKAAAADRRTKRRVRVLRAIQRVANLILSIFVLGIMLNTYLTFTSHRATVTPSGQKILLYPSNPETWPTFMMIATAGVSLIFNFTILASYYCGIGAANRVSSYAGYWGYLIHILNFAVWLATSTTFKMMQGDKAAVPPPNDLWGWTCSDAADQLTAEVPNIVNFDLQCTTQQVSFAMGLVNAGLEIFGIIISIIAFRRMRHKKKLAELERRTNTGVNAAY